LSEEWIKDGEVVHQIKKIILNPEIIKAPVKCIDYVIIHELCHLIHHNHGKEFYTLQNRIYGR